VLDADATIRIVLAPERDELYRRINELRPGQLQVIVPQVEARLWVPFHRTHYPHHLTRTIYD
jgi:hypothetical protein